MCQYCFYVFSRLRPSPNSHFKRCWVYHAIPVFPPSRITNTGKCYIFLSTKASAAGPSPERITRAHSRIFSLLPPQQGERGRQAKPRPCQRGASLPPANPRELKAVRITAPPPSLMNSKHASADETPSTQTGTKEKGKEARESRERKKKDGRGAGTGPRTQAEQRSWTGGVSTFCSTPDGLNQSWRPQKDCYEGCTKTGPTQGQPQGVV